MLLTIPIVTFSSVSLVENYSHPLMLFDQIPEEQNYSILDYIISHILGFDSLISCVSIFIRKHTAISQ